MTELFCTMMRETIPVIDAIVSKEENQANQTENV
jgi:hypothetical protein